MSSTPANRGTAAGLDRASAITPAARPDLQSIIPHAACLARGIGLMDPAALSLEVRDTLGALLPQLDEVQANRASGEIGIGNGLMCRIACDAAHLLAALLSPEESLNPDALQGAPRDAFEALKVQLYRLGLLDNYERGEGVYSA